MDLVANLSIYLVIYRAINLKFRLRPFMGTGEHLEVGTKYIRTSGT